MMSPAPKPLAFRRAPESFSVLFGFWTLVVGGVLGGVLYFSKHEDQQVALFRAIDSFQKDVAYRSWAAERGGVYVPLDDKTPVNPHLADRPNRDVTTTTGIRLTLVNPAYMTRMVHELGAKKYGLRGHITSLNPIRPENVPDDWERRALRAFEGGARSYHEVIQGKEGPVLRYIGAFLVDQGCLGCHAKQGYKVGDVRGGISVTVPVVSGSLTHGLTHRGISVLSVLSFWAMGGIGLFLWTRKLALSAADQQRLLSKLEDSSQRFKQLFRLSPAPLFIHRDGRITDANLATARLLDAETPEALLGLDFLLFIHPAFRDIVLDRIRMAQRTHEPTPLLEETFLTLQGREVPVEVQSFALDLPDGSATLVFAQDLTDRHRAEEEHRKLEAELQHAKNLESLGSLAGGIAHDMNNVLAAILGLSSLLQMKQKDDEGLVKSLRTIENAATRGRDLVKGLTDFARKGLHEAKIMDLNALIQKELDLLIRTSRQRFTFDVQLTDGLPPIMGEPSTLGSAFMNLCVNAFDAMPQGGTLSIRTSLDENRVLLCVADTGEGIPPDILPRVMDPFFTTKPPGRGTGLGLAMVYGAMKAHGGSLDIRSEVGKGTQISLRFPVVALGASVVDPAVPNFTQSDLPLRILLVDDDELIRSTLPPMLQQLGHQVETASSGLEAIRRLDAGLEADLVILDHNMPGLSGADTLPRILALRPKIRILVASGFLDNDLKMLLAGFPSVLTIQKPFTLDELRRILQRPASHRQA